MARGAAQQGKVVVAKAPEGAPLKHDYRVMVQQRGSDSWFDVDTYMARVNAPQPDGKHARTEISYAMFDFTGDVVVRVVRCGKRFATVNVRPKSKGIGTTMVNDSTIQFMLTKPENLSVEFDGDITSNLLLFTSEPCITADDAKKEAKKQKRDFVYYAPGLYTADTIRVKSNSTVYLSPGCYFTGSFAIEDAHDVRYTGKLPNLSIITGYDANHTVDSVTFENLTVNGRTISDDMPGKPPYHQTAAYVPMFVGSHVKNLKFFK